MKKSISSWTSFWLIPPLSPGGGHCLWCACQPPMDFLFSSHQTSFILSSFQTLLVNSSIKVECVQGMVKDLNWNTRRQTERGKWCVNPPSEPLIGQSSRMHLLIGSFWSSTFLREEQSCLVGWEYILCEGIIKIILNRNILWAWHQPWW